MCFLFFPGEVTRSAAMCATPCFCSSSWLPVSWPVLASYGCRSHWNRIWTLWKKNCILVRHTDEWIDICIRYNFHQITLFDADIYDPGMQLYMVVGLYRFHTAVLKYIMLCESSGIQPENVFTWDTKIERGSENKAKETWGYWKRRQGFDQTVVQPDWD